MNRRDWQDCTKVVLLGSLLGLGLLWYSIQVWNLVHPW